MNLKTLITAASSVLISHQALAHPGHDHSFWASDAVHAITFASIVGVAAVALYSFKKSRAAAHAKKHSSK